MIEIVAGYFSVIGLAALFAAAFWPVVIMGGTLEAGKLVAATWLKANLKNPNVAAIHKGFLLVAILALMAITSLGIYGYLAKAHLEQEANLPAIELQIKQSETRIAQADAERLRQEARLGQLDQSVSVLLSNATNAKDARSANLARDAQRRDRADIQKQITALNREVNTLNEALVPLRLKVSDVSAKLGPVKYVASLFGWKDPNSAVQLVILLIMIAFDPLAVVMVLSGTLSLSEAVREMSEKREKRRREKATKVTELPKGETLGDLDFFTKRPAISVPIPESYFKLGEEEPLVTSVDEILARQKRDKKAKEDSAAAALLRQDGVASNLSPVSPEPAKGVPVFMFDPNEQASSEPAPSPVITQTVEVEQLQRVHEDNARLTRALDEQNATFEALQAEIARLKALPVEKEKLTDEPKTEMIEPVTSAGFNDFIDSRIQPSK
jgi:hypothetical protein